MSCSKVEIILGKDEYKNLLLDGFEHIFIQLTDVLKINIPKVKMLCINDPAKMIYLEKFVNLKVLLIDLKNFVGNVPVYSVNLLKCKNLKTLIFYDVRITSNNKHKNYLFQFINNLPKTLENIVIDINEKNTLHINHNWTTHNFDYITNLPIGLKYFVIFVTQNIAEYPVRKFTKNRIKVPFDCRIVYSINYIGKGKPRRKENIIILDEYIEEE